MKAVSSRSISEITRTQTEGADIPEGWVKAPVWGIMNLVNGFPFKPSHWKTTGHPIIRIQNLNNPEAPFNYCPDEIPDKYRVNAGDLLFAWSGTPGTSFGAHIWQGGPAWLNQHIFRVEFNEEFLNKKLVRLAINQNLNDYIDQAHGGAGLAHIKKGEFESSFLLIPPIAEQDRIVAKVDELLAGVNSARERLARVPGILKQFRQSVLAAACSGRLTADWREKQTDLDPASRLIERIYAERLRRYGENSAESKSKKGRLTKTPTKPQICSLTDLPEVPDGWVWMTCGQLCQPERALTYGVIKLGPPVLNGIPTLRSSDVRNLFIDEGGIKRISPVIAAEYSRTFLEGGELVVTVRGTLGGVAVVPAHMKGYNVSREVAVIPIEPIFNASFFACAIGSVWGKNWLKEVAKGVTYTGINIEDLKLLPLPVPPLSEQHEIVRRVEALFRLADAIEARVAMATARADQLTQAILAKAFRGELVPTEAELARRAGRDFEPAAVLLSRLQEERRLITEAQPRRQTLKGRKRQTAGT